MDFVLTERARKIHDLRVLHQTMKILFKLDILNREPSDFLMLMSMDYKDPTNAYIKLYEGNSP